MARIEKTVFISYRRTNVPWALAISQNLTHNGYDVFFDYTGLASGDFESVILENIHARAHFLVLLTPSALERCSDPGDWLRREIEAALDSQRNIVPLMLEGFDFGTPSIADQLTGKLAVAQEVQRHERVPAEYFDAAMDKLRNKFLNVALDTVVQPASPAAPQARHGAKRQPSQRPQQSPKKNLPHSNGSSEGLMQPTLMSRCASIARPSDSSPTSPWPSTTAASHVATKATSTARSRTTMRPSVSSPTIAETLQQPGHHSYKAKGDWTAHLRLQ